MNEALDHDCDDCDNQRDFTSQGCYAENAQGNQSKQNLIDTRMTQVSFAVLFTFAYHWKYNINHWKYRLKFIYSTKIPNFETCEMGPRPRVTLQR